MIGAVFKWVKLGFFTPFCQNKVFLLGGWCCLSYEMGFCSFIGVSPSIILLLVAIRVAVVCDSVFDCLKI